MRNKLLSWSVLAWLLVACIEVPAPAADGEFRGIWVDAWGAGFLTPTEAEKLIADCRTYNFNAVIVQMRRRGDAFYIPQSPNLEPRTTDIASGYDALAKLIDEAHNGTPRIEVHCWVTSNLIWSGENPPSQAGHVYNRHPEYLMKNQAGEKYLAEGYYLDPGNPDAMLWNYHMARDIVSRYDVDGFHWDYIRYPQADAGYNDVALERFRDEFNLTDSYRPSPSAPAFSQWRRRQVTDFLRWVNADLLEIKPGLVISAAVFGSRTDAFSNRYQDWAAWNEEGIIDVCMPMNYSANNSGVFFPRADDARLHQGVRRVYMGQGAYLNTKENTVTQLDYALDRFQGTVFYSYRTPNSGGVNQPATFSHVRSSLQPTWQPVPELPWKVSPTRGIVKGSVTESGTGKTIYNATVKLEGPAPRTLKAGLHGSYAFFEAPPMPQLVTVSAPGYDTITQAVNVTAGLVSDLDFALPLTGTIEPIQILSITRLPDSEWRVEVEATPGRLYSLLGSSDLQDWVVWGRTSATNAQFEFNLSAAEEGTQFFRVRRGE